MNEGCLFPTCLHGTQWWGLGEPCSEHMQKEAGRPDHEVEGKRCDPPPSRELRE